MNANQASQARTHPAGSFSLLTAVRQIKKEWYELGRFPNCVDHIPDPVGIFGGDPGACIPVDSAVRLLPPDFRGWMRRFLEKLADRA